MRPFIYSQQQTADIAREAFRKKNLPEDRALVFDDVEIIDRYSDIARRGDIQDFSTRITRNLKINFPVVSVNMATITGADMAITMARWGGIGMIHQFFPFDEAGGHFLQAEEVAKVKRTESGVIREPFCISPETTVAEIKERMERFQISGFLVTDEAQKLIGIISQRDVAFEDTQTKKAGEVMTSSNIITGECDISLDEAKKLLVKNRKEKLPLVDAAGKVCGLITLRDLMSAQKFPRAAKDSRGRLLVAAAVGISRDILRRAEKLLDAGADVIVLDTARGNAKPVEIAVREIKKAFGEQAQVIAGNVDTPDGVKMLADAGADGVKVGIGPGSACETRLVAGVGIPQLSAIVGCAAIGEQYGIPIMADGGGRIPADPVKAIAAGASTFATGGMLAGTKETPGTIIYEDGKAYKFYHGSASFEFQMERQDRVSEGATVTDVRTPEGVSKKVPYRGEVGPILKSFLEAFQSAMSYTGCRTIDALRENASFAYQSSHAAKENEPHNA
jgi:IMP dehydrogenase